MTLYEALTGWMGESHERCYIWAWDEEAARKLFAATYPHRELRELKILLGSQDDQPMITKLSDCGWEE